MKVDYYSGRLQAVGVGSAWITATTSDGYSAEFCVEIEKLVKYVTVKHNCKGTFGWRERYFRNHSPVLSRAIKIVL